MKLRGSSVLVTGASRGLGRAVARRLAHHGAQVTMTARDPGALAHAADELRQLTEILSIAGDVSDPAHVDVLVEGALRAFGRIDILINNASTIGPSPMPPLAVYPLDALEEVFRVNTFAPLRLIQRVVPSMRGQQHGVIVNLTSDAGSEAYPGWGGYGATKAALDLASRVLAAELAADGIRVYLVDPGDMNTQMHREAEPGVDLSHLAAPEDVAGAVLHILEMEPADLRIRAQDLLLAR